MEHAHKPGFARRMASASVRAARRANRLAIICRDEPETREVWREVARVNIAEAKRRKQSALMRGEW